MDKKDWQSKLRLLMEGHSEPLPSSLRDSVLYELERKWSRQKRRRRVLYASGMACTAVAALAVVFLVRGTLNTSVEEIPSDKLALLEDTVENEINTVERPGALVTETSLPQVEVSSGLLTRDISDNLPAILQKEREITGGVKNEEKEEVQNEAREKEESKEKKEVKEEVLDEAKSEAGENPLGGLGETPAVRDAVLAEEKTSISESENTFEEIESYFSSFPEEKKRKKVRTSLNLVASNINYSKAESSGYGSMNGATVMRVSTLGFTSSDDYSEVLLSNNSSSVNTSRVHSQPVSLGISLSLWLSERFALESGVEYSYLLSDLSSGTSSASYDIRQTLHYLGVPLKIRYSFWMPKNWDFYLSAGGMVQKCLWGESKTIYVKEASALSDVSSKITEDALQWSVGAAAGLSYRFNNYFGLYLEPGIRYYLDNGSYVENIYKDRALNFSLSLGLRFYLN